MQLATAEVAVHTHLGSLPCRSAATGTKSGRRCHQGEPSRFGAPLLLVLGPASWSCERPNKGPRGPRSSAGAREEEPPCRCRHRSPLPLHTRH